MAFRDNPNFPISPVPRQTHEIPAALYGKLPQVHPRSNLPPSNYNHPPILIPHKYPPHTNQFPIQPFMDCRQPVIRRTAAAPPVNKLLVRKQHICTLSEAAHSYCPNPKPKNASLYHQTHPFTNCSKSCPFSALQKLRQHLRAAGKARDFQTRGPLCHLRVIVRAAALLYPYISRIHPILFFYRENRIHHRLHIFYPHIRCRIVIFPVCIYRKRDFCCS